ncbi:hypothetical protein N7454_003663 [Penicillium verhagenii]|nr:hypothetical protein N7454_003663 [Penicillium verhagenii]
MSQPRNTQAPWRDALASNLEQTPGYEFTLGTVDYDSNGRAVPRVRTCGCRGFFPELKLHPSGQEDMKQQVEDGGNPHIYESDMLTFTTDTRMEKLPQIDSSGNAVEAIFWLQDLMTQWRVKGRAFAIGSPSGEEHEGEKISRAEINHGLRTKENSSGDVKKWTWEKAVTEYFANHSPMMRVHLRGSLDPSCLVIPPLQLGQKVTDLHDTVSRANFRVVVIVPDEVERLDLSDMNDVRREKWTFIADLGEGESKGSWEQMELWP